MTCWPRMESRRGSSDRAAHIGNKQERWPSTTKDAAQNPSPTGTWRYQPSRKSVGSKEDWPDISSYLQLTRVHRDHSDLTKHYLAHNGIRWLEMRLHGKRLCEQQTQTTNTTHDLLSPVRTGNLKKGFRERSSSPESENVCVCARMRVYGNVRFDVRRPCVRLSVSVSVLCQAQWAMCCPSQL